MLPISDLLVVAPHCDDEVLQAGGLIARTLREGGNALVAPVFDFTDTRRTEISHAATSVGFTVVDLLGHGQAVRDSHMFVAEIEALLDHHRPDCMVIPGPSTHHHHQIVRDACLAATRPNGTTGHWRPPLILSGEALADQWAGEPAGRWWVELTVVDVTVKLGGMAMHASQMRDSPSERSLEAIEALARVRGSEAGVDFAERYTVERALWTT